MNRKYEIIPLLFWMGLSVFAMVGSFKLELGDFRDPGAGLVPFLLGAVLFLISVPMVAKSLFNLRATDEIVKKAPAGKIDLAKVISVTLSLFAYCLLLRRLGYLVTTTLLFIFLFKTASPRPWRFVIIASVLTAVVTYVGFRFLGLRFPRGIFGV